MNYHPDNINEVDPNGTRVGPIRPYIVDIGMEITAAKKTCKKYYKWQT